MSVQPVYPNGKPSTPNIKCENCGFDKISERLMDLGEVICPRCRKLASGEDEIELMKN